MLEVSRQSDERGVDGAGGTSYRSSSLSTFRPLSTLSELRVGKPQLSGEISAELPLPCVSLRAAPQSADPTTYLSDSEEQQASCQRKRLARGEVSEGLLSGVGGDNHRRLCLLLWALDLTCRSDTHTLPPSLAQSHIISPSLPPSPSLILHSARATLPAPAHILSLLESAETCAQAWLLRSRNDRTTLPPNQPVSQPLRVPSSFAK